MPDLTAKHSHRHAVEALYHLTRTLDSTRPVIGNDGWESSATDIIGIHDYDANTEHIRQRYGPEIKPEQLFDRRRPGGRILTLDGYPHRGQPIMLTEFGGVAFSNGAKSNGTQTWGYTTVSTEAEFTELFQQLLHTVIHTALFSGFATRNSPTRSRKPMVCCSPTERRKFLELIAEATSASPTHVRGVV